MVDQCIDKDTCKPEILESILHEAAISPNVSEPSRYRSKPWDEPEVQDLLRKRREAATPIQRKTISKTIQKVLRKLVRKHNDAKVEVILKEFADLGRLEKIRKIQNRKKKHPIQSNQ